MLPPLVVRHHASRLGPSASSLATAAVAAAGFGGASGSGKQGTGSSASIPLRRFVAPVLQKSRRGIDEEVRLCSRGSTPDSRGLFDPLGLDMFEGNGKQMWMDLKSGWCHLCQEPIGSSMGIHIGDRDHICLALFVHLYVNYPRRWSPEGVMLSSECQFPSVHNHASTHTTTDHLHELTDAQRRADLEAILLHLCHAPHRALSHVLQGRSPSAFWYSGERMFKINLSRLASVMLPPMNAGVLTTFTHKCWGRSNLERMYDALNISRINKTFGVDGKTTKDHKAYYMRSIFYELQSAPYRDDIDEVTRLLIASAKRRLSFECIFLQSMHYMNRIQDIVAQLEYPTPEMLQQMNLT